MASSPPDGSPTRISAALTAALALHVALATLTIARPPDAVPAGIPLSSEATAPLPPTIDIDLTNAPQPLPTPTIPAPDSTATAPSHPTHTTRPHDAPAPAEPLAEPGASPGSNSTTSTLDPSASAPAPPSTIDLGIARGDWSRWSTALPSAPPAPEAKPGAAPAPMSTTGGLAEGLEAHDQALGLSPAGAVLTAARDAAHTDVAPQLGKATFAITVLRTGVVDVQLTGASSQVDGWQQVAATMAENIRKKPPQIHPPRNGVRIGLEVVAEEHWPNGALARSESPHLTASGFKFHAVDTAKEELARRNPAALPPPDSPTTQPSLQANVDLPGVFVEGRGKVCSYKIGVTPFGLGASGGCDPANIGAPPQRVVSTRVVSETMF